MVLWIGFSSLHVISRNMYLNWMTRQFRIWNFHVMALSRQSWWAIQICLCSLLVNLSQTKTQESLVYCLHKHKLLWVMIYPTLKWVQFRVTIMDPLRRTPSPRRHLMGVMTSECWCKLHKLLSDQIIMICGSPKMELRARSHGLGWGPNRGPKRWDQNCVGGGRSSEVYMT